MSKVSWKDIFAGFQQTVFENKLTFVKKKKRYCIQRLIYCIARQVLHDLFSNNQENGAKMTFVQELLK